jgi:hypothetical protein
MTASYSLEVIYVSAQILLGWAVPAYLASSVSDLLIQSMYTYYGFMFSQKQFVSCALLALICCLVCSCVLHPSLRIAQRFDRAVATSIFEVTAKAKSCRCDGSGSHD